MPEPQARRRLEERAGVFTNLARMNKLLALMALAWADRLCEHTYLAGGHAAQQRPHDDPIDVVSLTRGPVADRSEAA